MKKLNEWQDAKGNKINLSNSSTSSSTGNNSSSSYYKRLRKLLNYHIDHKDSDVDKIVTNDVRNFGLDYIEHHKGQFEGGYFKKVAVRMSDTGDWYFTVDLDNKQIVNKVGKGWDKLVYELSFNLNLPQVTSDPEYQDLLTEWVDSNGNKVNFNDPPVDDESEENGIPDQAYRYQRLIAQIQSDKLCRIQVNTLTSTVLEITTSKNVKVKIERLPHFPNYILKIGNHRMSYDDYEDVLDALIEEGIISDTDLCESLEEWVDTKGNKVSLNKSSSKTNKEKFEELIQYMDKHLAPYSTKVEASCSDAHFHYSIRCTPPGIKFYTVSLQIHHSRFDSSWNFRTYKSGEQIDDASGKGWEELLMKVRSSRFGDYVDIPKPGSKEYDSLCEWIDKNGQKISTATPVTFKSTDFTERYKKLVAHISSMYKCQVIRLGSQTLEINLTYGLFRQKLLVIYDYQHQCLRAILTDTTTGKTVDSCDCYGGWDVLLTWLMRLGFVKNKKLCESVSTIDEFKTYETLWD